MLAQASGAPPRTLLFVILGVACVGLSALALGTWAGSARAAYIWRYNKAHGTKLPAGYLEEWVRQGTLNRESRRIDPLGIERTQRRQEQATRIWAALDESQADPELERLRLRAQRRNVVAVSIFGVATVAVCLYLYFFAPR